MKDDRERGASIEGDGRFRAVVVGAAVVVTAALLFARFGYDIDLPAMPPKPPGPLEKARSAADRVSGSESAYRQRVARDARSFGVDTAPEEMERAFAYRREEPGATLYPGDERDALDVAGLRLRLEVEPVPRSHRQQMVLSIENTLEKPVAYRVATRPTAGTRTCRHKHSLPHDAIALAPGATARRSECTFEPGWGLEIRSVEIVELPELGYFYVSQLRPRYLGLSGRTSAAHRPAQGAPCDLLLAATVTRALERGELSWRDAVDFYARHDCRHFTLPADYEAFDADGARRLPVTRGR